MRAGFWPCGGNVECFVDRFTGEAADEFAQTELFRNSAAGMDIDCEELLARMEAGATEETLMALDEEKFAAVDLQETVQRHSRMMLQ